MAVEVGQSAPDFTLYDTDRQQRSLSEFRGKSVVLAMNRSHGAELVVDQRQQPTHGRFSICAPEIHQDTGQVSLGRWGHREPFAN